MRWLVWDVVIHVVLAGLCTWAVGVHYWYRLLGPPIVQMIPWLGALLLAMTLLAFLRHALVRGWPEAAALPLVRRVQRTTDWAVLGFCVFSALVLLNGARSVPIGAQPTEVIEIGAVEIDLGQRLLYSWATVKDWELAGRSRPLVLWESERGRLWGGAPVLVHVRQGPLGLQLIGAIERDEGRRLGAILEQMPMAAIPRRELAFWYVRQKRFQDAALVARDYYRYYPRDVHFALRLAGRLAGAERWADLVPVLEPFVHQEPRYEVYSHLGYGLTHAGRLAEGAALLAKASALRPDDWWPYYALGYAYADANRYQDAVVMLEKAQARGVRLLEVEAKLQHLRSLAKIYGGNHPSTRKPP